MLLLLRFTGPDIPTAPIPSSPTSYSYLSLYYIYLFIYYGGRVQLEKASLGVYYLRQNNSD
uniref:Uncharacterized protein n=2 Tax=Picea TaxID=3328 RepID=A0A101M1P5_PICGL|nr:hypothetical protein ABT39_MTgene3837 [Picea glauca]QHR90170.1 hypothetical protein Q903MT_gene4193 [Picea sitchensis]